MSDVLPEARRIRRKLPGLVWAVPVAALIVCGYLGVNAVLERGVDVIVTFEDAAAAKVRDTHVMYKGLAVGKVVKIELADDKEHVEMTLRMTRKMTPLLTTGTQFWMVGANPTFSDLSSLTTAVTGIEIEIAPGPGEPSRLFSGLDRPPIIYPGTAGKRLILQGDSRGALRPGSRVSYRGDDAGKVTEVRFEPPRSFIVEVFITEPFSQVLREDSMFWMGGGVTVQLTAQGVSTSLPSANDILGGSVAFDTRLADAKSAESPDGTAYHLYADEASARDGDDGEGVLYETSFDSAGGVLGKGAPVTLMGFRIGRVRTHILHVDRESGGVVSPVTLAIFPRRLGFDQSGRDATDTFMAKLVERGYKLRVIQSPPIVGALNIELVKTDTKGRIEQGAEYPRLPTSSTGDIAALTATASSILDKINQIPIASIGNELRGTAAHLNKVLAAVEPQIEPTMRELRASAAAVQGTAAEARAVMTGEGAAQGTSIPEAMRQLTNAARSLRALADSIEEHPESLLFGKGEDKK